MALLGWGVPDMQVYHGLLVGDVAGFEMLALQPLTHPVGSLAGVHGGFGEPVLFENAESGRQVQHQLLQANAGS